MRGWFREAFALLAGVGIFIAYVAHSWAAFLIDSVALLVVLVVWLRTRGEDNPAKPS